MIGQKRRKNGEKEEGSEGKKGKRNEKKRGLQFTFLITPLACQTVSGNRRVWVWHRP